MARRVARRPELLAEDRVAGACPREVVADEALRLLVGDGDRGQIRLGLDLEVLGVEVRPGQRIGGAGEAGVLIRRG